MVRGIHERVRGRAPDGRRYGLGPAPARLGPRGRGGQLPRRIPAVRLVAADGGGGGRVRRSVRLGRRAARGRRSAADVSSSQRLSTTTGRSWPERPAAHEAARFLLLHPRSAGSSGPGTRVWRPARSLLALWAKEMLRPAGAPGDGAGGDAAGRLTRGQRGAMGADRPAAPAEDLREEWRRLNPRLAEVSRAGPSPRPLRHPPRPSLVSSGPCRSAEPLRRPPPGLLYLSLVPQDPVAQPTIASTNASASNGARSSGPHPDRPA